MSPEQAQKLIVISTLFTVGSTTVNVLKKPKNQKQNLNAHRVIAGGLFAMAGCSVIAEFSPEAGAGLAALVAGGAFIKYGLPVATEYFGTPLRGVKGGTNTGSPLENVSGGVSQNPLEGVGNSPIGVRGSTK